MMNRREALGAMAGAAVSFVLPAPRKRIDLRQFCSRHEWGKYSTVLPWEHADWTYATDCRVCVRVRPESGDAHHHTGEMPPFDSLSWNHNRIRGWREMPRLTPLEADSSVCPACDGSGFEGGVIGTDCEACYGNGWLHCPACGGEAVVAPPGVGKCPACKGKAIGRFASVVCLGGSYFDVTLYERVRALGCEFVPDCWNAMASHPMLKFRFDGGLGMLMSMDPVGVTKRLVKEQR